MLKFLGSGEVASLGLYCERVALGEWQEPFNTFSALAFVCAGLLGLRMCFGSAKGDGLRLFMALSTMSIGVVSFAFHMHGTRLSLVYDLLPILLFDILASWAVLSRGLKMATMETFFTIIFILATSFALTPLSNLHGFAFSGIEHTGFVFWLLLLSFALMMRGEFASGGTLFLGGVVLVFALFFKSIDIPQCAQYTHGTHWMWHLANAVASYLIIRGIPLSSKRHAEVEVSTRF